MKPRGILVAAMLMLAITLVLIAISGSQSRVSPMGADAAVGFSPCLAQPARDSPAG